MRVVFAGVFPVENAPATGEDGGEDVRWQCRVCYSWNETQAKPEPPSGSVDYHCDPKCRVCARPQQPQWLKLAKHDVQITLGSLVTLTQFVESEDAQLGVVVAIDFVVKKLQVLSVRKSKGAKTETREQLRFNDVVIHQDQVGEKLEPFDSSDGSDWIGLLGEYAICGECRHVFHVSQGDLQSKFANENVLRTLQLEIETLVMQKQQQIRLNKCELVLETTSEIQRKKQQVQRARRQLEFLNPLFCPFCGWKRPE